MNSTQHSAVQAINVAKQFGGRGGLPKVNALRGVSLDIASGQMTAIVGPSGCGKSTLLFALAGLDRPTEGQVLIEGHDLGTMKDDQIALLYRDAMGFVFQSFNLIPSLNTLENVVISDRLAVREIDRFRALNLLQLLGLSDKSKAAISSLSNGQQQRVALARVLYGQPRIVFADEPTGALDSSNSAVVLDHLRRYADEGHTVVMVTHDLEAASKADKVLVMRDGIITHSLRAPTPDQLLSLIRDTGISSPNNGPRQ